MSDFTRDGKTYSSQYGGDTGYQDTFNQWVNYLGAVHSDSDSARGNVTSGLDSVINQFKSQFTNLVGRDPTADEISNFTNNQMNGVLKQAGGIGTNDPTATRNAIVQDIGDNYKKAAQDTATQQLQAQQGQANSLADLFRQQGNSAVDSYHTQGAKGISDTESSLLDYQSKLFDRLRPNLITSLKSQGLLDTGGMNEAVAGVQGDLANNASNYIAGLTQQQSQQEAQMRFQNEQGANQIAFGGAYAPYQYQQGNITGAPAYMQAQDANAVNFSNSTFMDNLNYQHSLGLLNAQRQQMESLQPSFFRTFTQAHAARPMSSDSNGSQYSFGGAGSSGAASSGDSYAGGNAAVAGAMA